MNDPLIRSELDTDLRRMDHMKHENAPEGANAYKVKVEPSTRTYNPLMHRFRYEIQYGKLDKDKFIPLGEPENTQTEALPMI